MTGSRGRKKTSDPTTMSASNGIRKTYNAITKPASRGLEKTFDTTTRPTSRSQKKRSKLASSSLFRLATNTVEVDPVLSQLRKPGEPPRNSPRSTTCPSKLNWRTLMSLPSKAWGPCTNVRCECRVDDRLQAWAEEEIRDMDKYVRIARMDPKDEVAPKRLVPTEDE